MHTVDRQDPENAEVSDHQQSLGAGQEIERDHDRNGSADLGPVLQLIGWWAGLLACVILLIGVHDLRRSPRQSIIILLIAGGVYVATCLWLHRRWNGWSAATGRRLLYLIVAGALVLRLLLLLVPPSLSDDVYRYRWDGRVQSAGLNPYTEPPASANLEWLRDPLWEGINYKNIRTIYPPLAEWLFAVTYLLHGGLLGYQLLAIVGDLLVIGLLLACLQRWRLPAWRVTLYAWSPLATVESASNAHFDSWAIAAVLLAIYAALRGAETLSTLAISAGILLKTWPLVWVPLLLRRRPFWHAALPIVGVTAAYLPYLGAGAGILQAWLEYTGRWLFNDAGFALLRVLAGGSVPLAKGLAAMVGLGLLSAFWRRHVDAVRGGYWLLLAAILLMPAIQPWYLLWPLPLAAACLDIGWITLTVLGPLAYWILVGAGPDSNLWVEPTWVRFVVYLPPLFLWCAQSFLHGPPAPPRLVETTSESPPVVAPSTAMP